MLVARKYRCSKNDVKLVAENQIIPLTSSSSLSALEAIMFDVLHMLYVPKAIKLSFLLMFNINVQPDRSHITARNVP